VRARLGPSRLHSVWVCMRVPLCANACSQGSTQGSKQACGCACGGAGVLACMQDGTPCPPLLMDASIVADNARHGWPEVGGGRGCACMEPAHAEEPCAPTPSALLRPSSHGVSPFGLPDAHAAVAHGMRVRSPSCDGFPAHEFA